MRQTAPPSEIRRLAAPLVRLLDQGWRHMAWWVALMGVLYALSGITVVKADEVAVVLRWGRLVGDSPGLQQHGPGLLFAFPRPIDRVVRVPVKHVYEAFISTLTDDAEAIGNKDEQNRPTLDPLTQGYALTGDQNIVHMTIVARYRIREPGLWAFYGPKSQDVVRVEVVSAMVRSLGEMTVDRVLADGRKDLLSLAMRRAQHGLDAAFSGVELSSLELTKLVPPVAVSGEFDAVQSAYIGAETRKKDAQAFAERTIPQAQGAANRAVQTARGDADTALAQARGDAGAFSALSREYRSNPVVVRERLYRNAIDRSLHNAGKIEWVPPPVGGNYRGFRVSIPSAGTQPKAGSAAEPDDDLVP